MIKGIGADIEKTDRFKKISEDFIKSLFSDREIRYCKSKKNFFLSFAGKFCAKEAVIKAYTRNLSMKDIEIVNELSGKVRVYINGKLNRNIHCNISHTDGYTIAFAIFEK